MLSPWAGLFSPCLLCVCLVLSCRKAAQVKAQRQQEQQLGAIFANFLVPRKDNGFHP